MNKKYTKFFPIIEDGCNISTFKFLIFNRWGQKVYESTSTTPGDFLKLGKRQMKPIYHSPKSGNPQMKVIKIFKWEKKPQMKVIKIFKWEKKPQIAVI